MSTSPVNILDMIGNTSLLELRHTVASNRVRILLKIESTNPTGSMKDRMALAMITAAEADGRLPPGGTVVEYTGWSTGVSLALVCAVKKHPLHVITSDAFSKEKLDHMRLLGAEPTIIPSDNACLRGVSERLRQRSNNIRFVAVEPAESTVLSGGSTGAHNIDGIGAGYVVPLWYNGIADEFKKISTEEARSMAFRLAREEGVFCGLPAGANVAAALQVAEHLTSGATVVTMMCDSGMKSRDRIGLNGHEGFEGFCVKDLSLG
ncbi:Cysteine synthase [Cladobotryum mycophilum]|uniref:Cysteine synthase n=1 Tax=Cladobotryum mycophilum TaxID=491253 RepID=A0ABR0SA96_9HYPO